jgi:RND family efflux transporter MFP subunit
MNEENNEEIIEAENAAERDETASGGQQKSRRQLIYIALAVISIVVLGAALFLIFRNREGGGQVVPAPRTVSFGDGENQQTSDSTAGQTVTLAPEQATRIGLKIETVGETLSQDAAQVAATGVVQPNAYNETPVVSLVGGIVRRINAELGENVSRGQTVAIVASDELAAAQSRYLSLQTEAQTAKQNYERALKLLKINPVSRADFDEAQARLKTKEAELDEMRRRYARTVKLVEIGASSREELEQDRTKLRTAEAELEQSRKQFARAAELVRINPTGSSESEQASVKLKTAESELASAKQRLLLLGLSEQKVNALRSASQISAEIALTAPASGSITSRAINQGEVVEANKELMKVTNLSTVWIIAQIYEKDLGRMRTGSGASVTTDAYPGKLFRGRISYIDPEINQATRTAQARVELENPNQVLKIGMYVNIAFGATGAGEQTASVIPATAVQNLNNRQIVFAASADQPNVFVIKTVRLGAESNGQYVVLEGLNVGDKIVTEGSFLLRAELLKQNPVQQ